MLVSRTQPPPDRFPDTTPIGLLPAIAAIPREFMAGEGFLIRIGKIFDDLVGHAIDFSGGDQARFDGIGPNHPDDEAYEYRRLTTKEGNQEPAEDLK